ncbi:hypoxanthine phosphoribosyltransferase [Mycoplasma haemofelis Ohio2]|uniref:Hypoxanthine phosphoribosyltransferase n=1 Tax=Mycoplasma haemofelis (strain Ohio2) TaxID=859194 RepID=F6FFL2_MYCHI|nr:hypoxanthine phosphoribosyltransferase [Mycoplasma haemofelis Ohio2]
MSCSCEKPSVSNVHLDLGYWFQVYSAYFRYFLIKGRIGEDTFESFIKKFESLGLKFGCEASLDFKSLNRELDSELSPEERDLLSQINEVEATEAAEKLAIKDICDYQVRDFYDHLNNFKKLAFDFRYLSENSDSSNPLGIQFSIYFKDLQLLVDKFQSNRRFVESFNFETDINGSDSFEILNFLTRELDLFPVQFQSYSSCNWFFLAIRELARFAREVAGFVQLHGFSLSLGDMDEYLLSNVIEACDRVEKNSENVSCSLESFKIMMIDISNLFSNLNKVCLNIKPDEEFWKPCESNEHLDSLYLKIFSPHLLEENLNYIFLNEPEIRNIVNKLSSKINEGCAHHGDPVCLIFEQRESIPFIGQLLPYLDFPCTLVPLEDLSKESVERCEGVLDGRKAIFLGTLLREASYIDKIKESIMKEDLKIGFLFVFDSLASTPIDIDFLGECIPDEDWVGFGLGSKHKCCNLNAIGVLRE